MAQHDLVYHAMNGLPQTAPEIARECGLALPTVYTALAMLVSEGWAERVGRRGGRNLYRCTIPTGGVKPLSDDQLAAIREDVGPIDLTNFTPTGKPGW